MKKTEEKIVEFFNSRIERHILSYADDEAEHAVRSELRNSLRTRVINNPFDMLVRIIRIELEHEQGLNDNSVFPEWLEEAAREYASIRSEKLNKPVKDIIPCWNNAEAELPEGSIKLMAYLGARVLTRCKPLWATKKFRKTARVKGLNIK